MSGRGFAMGASVSLAGVLLGIAFWKLMVIAAVAGAVLAVLDLLEDR